MSEEVSAGRLLDSLRGAFRRGSKKTEAAAPEAVQAVTQLASPVLAEAPAEEVSVLAPPTTGIDMLATPTAPPIGEGEILRSPEHQRRLAEAAGMMLKLDTVVNDVNKLRGEGASGRSVGSDPLESLIGGVKVTVDGVETELTPEVFVGQWSKLIEGAGDADRQELLGMVEKFLIEGGKESLVRRMFVEYANNLPTGVSDNLRDRLGGVILGLRAGREIPQGAVEDLAKAAKEAANDKISLWSIVFWILGGLATVVNSGGDVVIKEVIEVTGGGR